LELQPDLRPALTNKALVESLLKQKNTPPPVEPETSDDNKAPSTEQESQPGAATQPTSEGEPQTDVQQTTPDAKQQTTSPPKPGANEVPGSELGDEQSTKPPPRPTSDTIEGEQLQALEQWLRKIPDDPGELLRRKFWYEQQQHQDQGKTR
jgi:Ca-activated chloride channel family protein